MTVFKESNWLYLFIVFTPFFATQLTYTDLDILSELGFGISESFRTAATCFSEGDCHSIADKYPNHHLQRALIHLFFGIISYYTELSLPSILMVANLSVLICSVWLLSQITSNPRMFAYIICLIILNPYGFRLFLLCPYYISEALFFLSILLFLVAFTRNNIPFLFIAIFVMAISRQTAIMFFPFLIFITISNRISKKIGIYLSVHLLLITGLNIFLTWSIFGASSGSTIQHVSNFSRGWFPDDSNNLDIIIYLKFFLLIGFNFVLVSPFFLHKINAKNIYIALFGYLLLLFQPILSGPLITGGNYSRLAVFAIPFLCLMLKNAAISIRKLIFILIVCFLFSLHHNYTITGDKTVYLILVLFTSMLLFVAFGYVFIRSYGLNIVKQKTY